MSLADRFKAILLAHPRVALVGGSKTGKTTLSRLTDGRPVIHVVADGENIEAAKGSTLLLGGYEPETPARIIAAVQMLPRFIVEGVQVARALRGPRGNGVRRPGLVVDAVVYLTAAKVPLSELRAGQVVQAIGTDTIFQEWWSRNQHVPVYQESLR